MSEVSPVFEDTEEKRFQEKAAQIVQEELKKQNEKNQSDNLSDKVNRIRERMEQQNKEVVKPTVAKQVDKQVDKHEDILCPTCGKHDLSLDNKVASCQGKDCDSSFLLLERFNKNKPVERKDYMCATCGYSMTKKEAIELKDKDKMCPLCGEDQTILVDVDWDNINKNLKKFDKDRKR